MLLCIYLTGEYCKLTSLPRVFEYRHSQSHKQDSYAVYSLWGHLSKQPAMFSFRPRTTVEKNSLTEVKLKWSLSQVRLGILFLMLTVNTPISNLKWHQESTRRSACWLYLTAISLHPLWLFPCSFHPYCDGQPMLSTTEWIGKLFFMLVKLLTAVDYFILAVLSPILRAFCSLPFLSHLLFIAHIIV